MIIPDIISYGLKKDDRILKSVHRELEFTKTFQKYANLHPYAREIQCLKCQVPNILLPIEDGDFFAGRVSRPAVGIDPERGELTECAYFAQLDLLDRNLQDNQVPQVTKKDIQYLIDFWKENHTGKFARQQFSEPVKIALPSDDYYTAKEIAYPMFGLGGPMPDYAKLVNLGIPGLRNEIAEKQKLPDKQDTDSKLFYESLNDALDILTDAALSYADQARQKTVKITDPIIKKRLLLIAESCTHIAHHKPQTYHQAIQLFWLYSVISLAKNYGRLDITLGDFLAKDLDAGTLTYDQALEITVGLWKLMNARGNNFNSRVIIGGKGRPNEQNADRFALLALDAQQAVNDIIPQLSLRCYQGMNPQLWQTSLDVIAKGSSFPIIYNDDINIPATAKAMDVTTAEAEQYFPYGCGEYIIEHVSIGSPDAALNIAKALNATLRNGFVPILNEYRGPQTGCLKDFSTFEQLQAAFAKQLQYQLQALAEAQDTIYRVTGQNAAYPFISMLYDDCIEKGKPLLAGGVRYKGATVETFGNNTAADSLLAIKKLVYDEKRIDPEELLAALDANFVGYENIRQMLKNVPKFGNDDSEADEMSLWLNNTLCESARRQKDRTTLDSFLVVIINNGDNVTLGKGTAATADGRKATMPLSNGNQPSAGTDANGPTALLNSMAKLNPAIHAGATQAIKLSRKMFAEHKPVLDALLKGYFAKGGAQLMITVTDRDELEKALKNPEQYANLIVRVGGYSDRFINLPEDVQQDVLARTLY